MLPGRVGDTPVIGAGIYAENDSGAVSCTGMGESIMRLSLAKEISVNAKEMPVSGAVALSLKRLLAIGGTAGVIAINGKGKFALMHTTEYMAAGYADGKGLVVGEGFKMLRR
jgi:beta-aspartyl-peptidase (threonine type)